MESEEAEKEISPIKEAEEPPEAEIDNRNQEVFNELHDTMNKQTIMFEKKLEQANKSPENSQDEPPAENQQMALVPFNDGGAGNQNNDNQLIPFPIDMDPDEYKRTNMAIDTLTYNTKEGEIIPLDDIDVERYIDPYILTDEQSQLKETIWRSQNADYLKQLKKRKKKEEEKRRLKKLNKDIHS